MTYYYNGDNLINESLNGSNTTSYLMGADGYICRKRSTAYEYYLKDAHGDVVYGMNQNGGRIGQYSYNAWGEYETEYSYYSEIYRSPIRYSGEYYDYESGMTYLRARYYDPQLRRFISEDPIKDGFNWYAYCGNNPVMFVDPWGLYGEPTSAEQFKPINESIMKIIACKAAYNPVKEGEGYAAYRDNLSDWAEYEKNQLLNYIEDTFGKDSNLYTVFSSVLSDVSKATIEEISTLLCVVSYCFDELTDVTVKGENPDFSLKTLVDVKNKAYKSNVVYYMYAERVDINEIQQGYFYPNEQYIQQENERMYTVTDGNYKIFKLAYPPDDQDEYQYAPDVPN